MRAHINYHAYHAKITSFGSFLMKDLQTCSIDGSRRNVVSNHKSQWNCDWNTCNFSTIYWTHFVEHVQDHVGAKLQCEWTSCGKSFKNVHKLKEHIRTHTKEKLIACPVCGTQFSNATKFRDHCKRQMSDKSKLYEFIANLHDK